mmetsp:Transcript_1594/g.2484  ORF Transcript_1594/g.2484 Transcript_1594/m.2484 type:complete len:260 (-) Transcript_1594:5-784(-)
MDSFFILMMAFILVSAHMRSSVLAFTRSHGSPSSLLAQGFNTNMSNESFFSRLSLPHARGVARERTILKMSEAVDEEVDPGEVAGLRIVRYPHPALRAKNEEITEFDDELKALSKNMLKLMYVAQGVGLAAPQVAKNVRLMVFNPEGDEKKWLFETVLVNPEIVERSEGQEQEVEGCLSFPGMSGPVQRAKWIKVKYQDLKGKSKKKKYVGWEARIFQHEYDHLEGVVYPDRLEEEAKQEVQARLNELVAEFGSAEKAL